MWRIIDRLYLGDEQDAHNRALLGDCGVTHVLNCAAEVACPFRGGFRYLHLELRDPDPAFIDHIPAIVEFIHAGRRRGAVMVHCRMGLSRSPSAILAYLCHRGRGLRRGMTLLRRRVGEEDDFIEPHEIFLEQLRDYFDLDEDD
jgi:hypothetical protein